MDEDGYVVGSQWIIQLVLLHIEDGDESQAQGGKCAYQRWKQAGQTTAELLQALAPSGFSFLIPDSNRVFIYFVYRTVSRAAICLLRPVDNRP